MPKKHNNIIDNICTSIYDGNINNAITLLNKHPELINTKSTNHDNKTLLMCTLKALENSSYTSEQQDLFELINIVIQNKTLDLMNTDDYGNNIFHLAFKYARLADYELSKALFNIGENFLKLIKDEHDLKKIVNKKNKSSSKKSQKNFLQYIFPNLQEENLSEQEIETLKHVQTRVSNILVRIFHFKNLLTDILQDPISLKPIITPFILPTTGVTLSWETWLKIIENSTSIPSKTIKQYIGNVKFNRTDLIHNSILESLIKIYNDNLSDEQMLIAKIDNYITINKKYIKQSKSISDIVVTNIVDLVENFKKYSNYINKLTPNRLGLQYDKNRH